MIDWQITKHETGKSKKYFDKFPHSIKKVYKICNGCGKESWVEFRTAYKLCHSCSHKGISHSNKTKQKMSDSHKGKYHSEETKRKISNVKKNKKFSENHKKNLSKAREGRVISEETKRKISNSLKGKLCSDETKKKISIANKGKSNNRKGKPSKNKGKLCSDETKKKIGDGNRGKKLSEKTKIKMSCIKQGIPIEDFDGFIKGQKYCSLWTESFREIIRERFHRKCYLCNTTQIRKLSVHHVNYNKSCLCGSTCEFVPLCMKCHAKTNTNRQYWEDLIMCYLYPNRYFMVEI